MIPYLTMCTSRKETVEHSFLIIIKKTRHVIISKMENPDFFFPNSGSDQDHFQSLMESKLDQDPSRYKRQYLQFGIILLTNKQRNGHINKRS